MYVKIKKFRILQVQLKYFSKVHHPHQTCCILIKDSIKQFLTKPSAACSMASMITPDSGHGQSSIKISIDHDQSQSFLGIFNLIESKI